MRLIVFEDGPMPGVGARFRDQVNLSPDDTAVLGRQDPAHELHLLHRVDAHDVDVIASAVLGDAALLGIRVSIRAIHAISRFRWRPGH